MAESRTYSLEEIAVLAEVPRRTVRYYIQSGLIDRPHGTGKGASYTQRHLEQLLLVRKWTLAGLSLEKTKELMTQPAGRLVPPTPRRAGTVEVWSHLIVADGVELTLEPSRAGLTPEKVREFFRAVTRAYQEINPRDSRESIRDSEKNK